MINIKIKKEFKTGNYKDYIFILLMIFLFLSNLSVTILCSNIYIKYLILMPLLSAWIFCSILYFRIHLIAKMLNEILEISEK